MALHEMMNYSQLFLEIFNELQQIEDRGRVADYIPELAHINPDHFGVHLTTIDGRQYAFGDSEVRFSIQSIAKVFTFVLAYSRVKSNIWERMDMEPAGTPFNSLIQLEYDRGIPRNPFINAGSMVVCDILADQLASPRENVLAFIRSLSRNSTVDYNPIVAHSEKRSGFRNYALVNLMKSFGNIRNEIDKVMDLYFSICSLEMSCRELSESFLFLANNGIVPHSGESILSPSRTKRTNALMQTCGFYDEAGQFTFKVGLPGKSGVGGGIVAVHPGKYAIAVWSPRLNKKGNSYKGMLFLEEFTTRTKLSIF
ncbi:MULTISPECIES: glutaminase [Petrimonas]|jgi:glutaminase|uniref:Glutaminase n=1 Tax=Petrimonas mucosa TaxID=1642646 RepID=A0A1G4G6F2_9BACT|nr:MULTISPECIES: glutaminase [Petrimonas]SCM57351.1 Glutaminase {ECO:0000255/HAMAP-Rule:MF_00313} [Petrimonas mucosa]SFU32685.1 L-glutaminase [Porphyromonadaceae bacterium KHP3R9]